MAYTRHGHHITGTSEENKPAAVARCGGPSLCADCSRDAWAVNHEELIVLDDVLLGEHKPNPILRYFVYAHLSPKMAEVSKPFCELAEKLDLILPDGPEKSTALRKLLEGKDAAVRAALDL